MWILNSYRTFINNASSPLRACWTVEDRSQKERKEKKEFEKLSNKYKSTVLQNVVDGYIKKQDALEPRIEELTKLVDGLRTLPTPQEATAPAKAKGSDTEFSDANVLKRRQPKQPSAVALAKALAPKKEPAQAKPGRKKPVIEVPAYYNETTTDASAPNTPVVKRKPRKPRESYESASDVGDIEDIRGPRVITKKIPRLAKADTVPMYLWIIN